jgi:hypothetical protein
MPALDEGRAEMDVEDVEECAAEFDIYAQAPARLATAPRDVVITGAPDRMAAQHDVAVSAPLMATVLSDVVIEPQIVGDELRLMLFVPPVFDAHDLLKGDNVSVNFAQDRGDAPGPHAPVEPLALVYVVGHDAESLFVAHLRSLLPALTSLASTL